MVHCAFSPLAGTPKVTFFFPGELDVASSLTRPFFALLAAVPFFAPGLVAAPAFAFRAALTLGAASPFDASSRASSFDASPFGGSTLAFDASESDENDSRTESADGPREADRRERRGGGYRGGRGTTAASRR